MYDGALMIALGDHGESLFNDNFLGHGHVLNDTQTRMPLVTNRSERKSPEEVQRDGALRARVAKPVAVWDGARQ